MRYQAKVLFLQYVETRDWQWNIPTKLPQMEGQQKETQYPRWHKDTTGKGLWSGEDNEFLQGNEDVRGNIELIDGWRDQYTDDFDTGQTHE